MRDLTCLVTGAAGFIGSHLTDALLARGCRVIGVDNLLLGRRSNLQAAAKSAHFSFVEGDVNDYRAWLPQLRGWLDGRPLDATWHLAANSDIRAGTNDPSVDLQHTFLSTFNALGLMRELGCRRLAFASTSAIYGPLPGKLREDTGPWHPISNYGAMKLAAEAAISAARETFLERAWVFRFPNVVGTRSTHGVIHDFIQKLRANPAELEVLGDGRQEKPYLHVAELVEAMLFITGRMEEPFNVCNIGPDGTATTVKHIAEAVVQRVSPGARTRYTGGAQGWPGDVPRFNYSIERLKTLGWTPRHTSDQAVERAIEELAKEL